MPAFPALALDDQVLASLLDFLHTGNDTGAPADGKEDGKELNHASLTPAKLAPNDPAAAPGALLYARHCAVCHGDRQEGITPSFPSLLGVGQRLTTAQITAVTRNGRGRMPAFSPTRLPEADLGTLLHFLGAKDILADPHAEADSFVPFNFTGYHKFYDPDGYPANKPPWGTLNAIDLNTGKYLWRIPFGEYPELKAQGLPATGSENYGGPVVTAGGLVFIGATVFDHKFRAFDSRTGRLLWETVLPVAGLATPATYMVDGKQFVVIAAGGGKDPKLPRAGFYLAFALP